MDKRAQDFDLPVDTNKLGCIMLEFDPLPILDWADPNAGYAFNTDGTQPWVQGPVAAKGSHVTLLYGLVKLYALHVDDVGVDHRTAGQEYRALVDDLLEDLELVGGRFSAVDLDVFENPAYDVVVARLSSTVLNEANRRLRLLPHIDTFVEYKPHVTLAYMEKGSGGEFADAIWADAYSTRFVGKAINYGGETII